jgi:RNA exonuclease NGL2
MPYDACIQAKGRGKQHGLVVLYRSERFGFKGSRVVHLDEEELTPGDGDEPEPDGRDAAAWQRWVDEQRRRRGGTRQTKNVGLIVGLEDKARTEGGGAGGVIVITTHL